MFREILDFVDERMLLCGDDGSTRARSLELVGKFEKINARCLESRDFAILRYVKCSLLKPLDRRRGFPGVRQLTPSPVHHRHRLLRNVRGS